MITFYIPLPAPVSTSLEFILTLDLGKPAPELHGLTLRVTEDGSGLPEPGNRFVSVRLIQTEIPAEIFGMAAESLRRVVKDQYPQLEALAEADRTDVDDTESMQAATVAECVTSLREDVDDPVSDAFDHCVDAAHDLSRAYRMFTRHAIPVTTFSTVPPVVFYVLRTITPPGETEHELGFFFAHARLPYGIGVEEMSGEDTERMIEYFSAMRRGHPGIPYLELRIESRLAHERHGTYRQSVALVHTAVEVLLDTVLGLMLWEEGVDAEKAASQVFSGYVSARVKREFHPRLGGNWQTEGRGAVAQYLRLLAPLRHRTVHLGYSPTGAESAEALRIAGAMEDHLSERLLAKKHLYRTTVCLFFGDRRLRERGEMSRTLRRHLETSDLDTWLADYNDWHASLIDVMASERAAYLPQK
jgi:hypothetical protein